MTSLVSHNSNASPGSPAFPPESGTPPLGFDLFETWKECEKVAMHFNDLLIRLRTQSLAAVAAVATVAGVLLKGDSIGNDLRWGTLLAVLTFLALFWLAIWVLDFTYYNRLLLGAVRSLLAIEKASKSSNRLPALTLSTDIDGAVRKGDAVFKLESWTMAKGRWGFYILVSVVLVFGVYVSTQRLGGVTGVLHLISGNAGSALP